MPTGLLLPDSAVIPTTPGEASSRLALSLDHHAQYLELAVTAHDARASRWVTTDAMTLLMDSFASTHSGWNPMLPQDLSSAELVAIGDKLGRFAREWKSVQSAAVARERWGDRSMLLAGIADDATWLEARETFGRTLDELAGFLGDAGRAGGTARFSP
jgi:hypothetical protein